MSAVGGIKNIHDTQVTLNINRHINYRKVAC